MIRSLRGSTGHALVIALVVLVLVGSAATAIAVGLGLENRTSLQESRRIRLVALADAALAEALAELDRSAGFQGVPERRLDKGTIASSVRRMGLYRYEITATANIAGWQREVLAEVDTSGGVPQVTSWRQLR